MLKVITCNNPGLQHQYGCNNVSQTMRNKLPDVLAIGIIDDDKRGIAYLKEFVEIEASRALKLYKHKSKLHYFITLYPAIEKFLIETAAQCKVNPADYHLPSDVNGLKTITKSQTSNKNPDLERFYKVLVKNKADSFAQIRQWIEKAPFISGRS
jgi:hypothetical protein